MSALPIWIESRSEFPPYVNGEKLDGVLARLTDEGRNQFAAEVAQAETRGGEGAVHDVVDAWHRTSLRIDSPGFLEAVAAAEDALATGPPLSDEEMDEIRRVAGARPPQ